MTRRSRLPQPPPDSPPLPPTEGKRMAAPVEPPHDYGLIEWMIGAAWVVVTAFGGVLVKVYRGLRRKITVVEANTAALERTVALLDHDLKGVRHNQVILEQHQQERHRQNQQEWAELREFLSEEMREMRRRIDRLLERTGGGMDHH